MALAQFRRSGGSTIVTMPAAVMEEAIRDGLSAEAAVEVRYDPKARAITMAEPRRRYTMAQMLAECDLDAPMPEEELAWANAPRMGQEAI